MDEQAKASIQRGGQWLAAFSFGEARCWIGS